MRLEKEREAICEYARRMLRAGLTRGSGGNISVLDRGALVMAITPSGVDYEKMGPGDIVLLDMEGKTLEGRLKPSSEWQMHLACYRARADVNAVVHTHSTFAVTLACLGWEIPPVHYLIGYAGTRVRCCRYERFGSEALAQLAAETLGQENAVLLGNHGLLATGPTLSYAFNAAEETEFVAEIYYRARLAGEPVLLPEEEMREVAPLFRTYGQ
ncbi:MAG: L-fuculose-phosphate aldolase [Clostridiales Family XIII bacterium]|jgi:L-fuculose-phosphate aldolase|nr:L-fuculose-phosphate aldolase [Clostridiales Family XIII bacterium]